VVVAVKVLGGGGEVVVVDLLTTHSTDTNARYTSSMENDNSSSLYLPFPLNNFRILVIDTTTTTTTTTNITTTITTTTIGT